MGKLNLRRLLKILPKPAKGGLAAVWLILKGGSNHASPSSPAPVYAETSPETVITKLPNGVTIASEAIPGPTVSVGVFIDSGSKYETPNSQGMSHLLERMAFKSTANRSHLRVTREIETIGANATASATREQMSYTADILKTHLPEAVEILADVVLNTNYKNHEVKHELRKMFTQLKGVTSNPNAMLLEVMHKAGYKGALGNPLFWDPTTNSLSGNIASQFVARNYSAPRIVVAAAGCEHKELLAVAEPLFGHLPPVEPTPAPESVYTGGEYRQAMGGAAHVALGFELEGGWRNIPSATAMTVLVTLLGGGGSFSPGGPGKGMYSRLYTRVLNRYHWVQNCTAFHSVQNDTGLVGISAVTEGAYAGDLVEVMVTELKAVAAKGAISDVELARAKKATISSVLIALENKAIVAEDIGRQILTYDKRMPTDDFVAAVEKVTAADLAALAAKLLKTPVTVAALGDVSKVPEYSTIAKAFQ
ncbi:hypothetical protein CYMTET_54421 [Cymbomonas tetramitiformis]|uniref:Alpha-MPP n=1 Tax=Cymbomonas tetramitiformis TaxID=36881 RepID=A0AAE0ENR0_9CHLO|nr:hypothetical protein CYMTET_54421 [Cymbomonas tetramitiformis]